MFFTDQPPLLKTFFPILLFFNRYFVYLNPFYRNHYYIFIDSFKTSTDTPTI